jgi:hypothetical protein
LIEMTTEAAQVFSSVRRSNSGCPRVRVCLATQRVEYGPEGRKGGLEVAPSVRRWVHGADVGKLEVRSPYRCAELIVESGRTITTPSYGPDGARRNPGMAHVEVS